MYVYVRSLSWAALKLVGLQVHPEKPIARRSWGNSRLLFGPFEVEHQAITDADTASGEAGDEVANGGGSQGEVKEKEKEKDKCLGKRKVRRNWSEELHRRFVLALEQLGGCHGGLVYLYDRCNQSKLKQSGFVQLYIVCIVNGKFN